MSTDLKAASRRFADVLRAGAPRSVVDAAAAEVDRLDDCPKVDACEGYAPAVDVTRGERFCTNCKVLL